MNMVQTAIGEGMVQMRSGATQLEMRGESLGADDAKILAEELKVNTSLTKLNLGTRAIFFFYKKNCIGDLGAGAFAAALCANTTLTTLGLCSNGIGDDGTRSLAEALRVNTSLTTLDLSLNLMGAEGAESLADALCWNSKLTSLNLCGNGIGARGSLAFADAIRVNASLTGLDLPGANIGAEGAAAIADALRVNSTLTSLDVRLNSIDSATLACIESELQVNKTLVDGPSTCPATLRGVLSTPPPAFQSVAKVKWQHAVIARVGSLLLAPPALPYPGTDPQTVALAVYIPTDGRVSNHPSIPWLQRCLRVALG
jgi:hypothetical protein